MTTATATNSTLEVALTYASWGWKVLPVVKNGKLPATAHGVHDATDDPEKIRRWWGTNPELNIGIAAGEKSGIIVYDIDPRNGGDSSWDKWLQENGKTPDGAMALTAGGGQHYLAVWQPNVRSCKLRDGIDLLADGRYFVAYPSTIDGKSYEWEASSDPFDGVAPFTIPMKWLMSMSPKKVERNASSDSGLIQGNRNDGLTALAGAMRGYGMTEAEILAAISVANETRCEIPLPSSEIRQIARSVSRYEPHSDVASSAALGGEAAESLLAGISAETEQTDYFLTRATSFLTQPSPLPWVVKGWIPAMATVMLYGESGVGKSFIALDIACSIASGIPWQGIKTKQGVVVYLAGEGNYGIRQRVASWCMANNVNNLDNLLISNKPIDLDSPGAALKVIAAVREITHDPILGLFVDTVNNHMSGDENSSRDTRMMINSCNIASMALNATTIFVHHTGLSDAAKGRARGSSAWRGALDSSILIAKAEEDKEVIKISCSKMKDTAAPEDIFGQLQSVDLGWVDEDGEDIKGAIFKLTNTPEKKYKESEFIKEVTMFRNAWYKTGAETRANTPYVSRSGMLDYLVSNMNLSHSTADTYIKPSKKGRLICTLLDNALIDTYENGWVVVDNDLSSQMMLSALCKD